MCKETVAPKLETYISPKRQRKLRTELNRLINKGDGIPEGLYEMVKCHHSGPSTTVEKATELLIKAKRIKWVRVNGSRSLVRTTNSQTENS